MQTFDVEVNSWTNMTSQPSKEPYKTLPGDLLMLTKTAPDILAVQQLQSDWAFALVTLIKGDDEYDDDDSDNTSSMRFKVNALKTPDRNDWQPKFVVYLVNLSTTKRIWTALGMSENLNIIKAVLHPNAWEKVLPRHSFILFFDRNLLGVINS